MRVDQRPAQLLASRMTSGPLRCGRSHMYPLSDASGHQLNTLSVEARRLEGVFYTPPHLVRFILDLAAYDHNASIEAWTLLDPACGDGAFLGEAVNRIAERLRQQGLDYSESSHCQEFLKVVEACLYGIDKDPQACFLARQIVRERVTSFISAAARVSEDYFKANVQQGDFLLDLAAEALPSARQSFRIIVGNPPYVPTNRLSDEVKEQLRARYYSANGRIDLYTLFMERAVELLALDGRLAFITPDKFLTSESARRLRGFLSRETTIESLATFRSHRVFSEAAIVPCVTVLRRDNTSGPIDLLRCGEKPDMAGRLPVTSRFVLQNTTLGEGPWHFVDPSWAALAHRLRANHPRLHALTDRISAGIASGLDRTFIVRADKVEDLESALLHPAARGQDLLPYTIRDSNLRIIIPYRDCNEGRAELVDIDEYPRIRNYLEPFRKLLEARHCVRCWGKKWYDLHDPWVPNLVTHTKILVPDVANSSRFAVDEGHYCPLHSAYYLIPKDIDPRFLAAVLNSQPLEFLVRLYAPVVKDGFSRYRKQFLRDLPIPIASLRTQQAIARAVEARDIEAVDGLSYRMFGISSTERKKVHLFLERARQAHQPEVKSK